MWLLFMIHTYLSLIASVVYAIIGIKLDESSRNIEKY
jgi:hypothetical protein